MKIIFVGISVAAATLSASANSTDSLFTGRIVSTITRAGQVETFIYTAGTNCLRIERAETDRPYTRNLVDRVSGKVTLLFPQNRSYMILENQNRASATLHLPEVNSVPMSVPSNAVGPQGIGPVANRLPGGSANLPSPPSIPQRPQAPATPARTGAPAAYPSMSMPAISMPAAQPLELVSTGEKTNFLGFVCQRYELKQLGETMEIWAASTKVPFAPWTQHPFRRLVGRSIEDKWGKFVMHKKLFPLLAVLKFSDGTQRFRYEVKSITPQNPADQPAELFLPPRDYVALVPLSD